MTPFSYFQLDSLAVETLECATRSVESLPILSQILTSFAKMSHGYMSLYMHGHITTCRNLFLIKNEHLDGIDLRLKGAPRVQDMIDPPFLLQIHKYI